MTPARPSGTANAIDLAERILVILDQGQFTATYKYAVLLAIVDLCFEKTRANGDPPQTITTRQLAEAVIALYWPQTLPRPETAGGALRQNTSGQAEMVSAILKFREGTVQDASLPLVRARALQSAAFERLCLEIEWKLIEMPIPRLQKVGTSEDRFLYDYAWAEGVSRADVRAYQQGQRSNFDNRLVLRPGVGESLLALNGLLRPLIYRQWTEMVARINGLPDSKLQDFLFGADRVALEPVRPGLFDLQQGACFYCSGKLAKDSQIDHFIPWARYPDNGIENLVLAHAKCNNSKRDFFAAETHLGHWRARNETHARALEDVAWQVHWERHAEQTLGVARAIYLRLPAHHQLWMRPGEFVLLDSTAVVGILA